MKVTISLEKTEIKEGETSPPKRYNSGSMILAMENAGQLIEDEELRAQIKGSGIGTSATRAEILKKLVNNKYIALNKKTQIITLWYNVSDETDIGGNNMCQTNYNTNKKEKKYSHINYTERRQIERWYNIEHKSKTEIAKLLNKNERTIRREIKRGLGDNLTCEWEVIYVYSAAMAQNKYDYNKTGKGPQLKLGNDYKLKEYIEKIEDFSNTNENLQLYKIDNNKIKIVVIVGTVEMFTKCREGHNDAILWKVSL